MKCRAIVALFITCCVTIGLTHAAVPIDSQVVLARYALAIDALKMPKAVIFNYAVSQSGPSMIDEHHVIYRSGVHVRDETISIGGSALRQREIRIGEREDHYALFRVTPRADAYGFVYVNIVRRGTQVGYRYDAIPLVRPTGGFVVDSVVIDAKTSLPMAIHFTTSSANAHGTGEISYARTGPYWMPIQASVTAKIHGNPARETIVFSAYRFPKKLPSGTFLSPKPLPQLSLPTF